MLWGARYCATTPLYAGPQRIEGERWEPWGGVLDTRISPQTVLVLTEFLQDPSEWKYGYEISRAKGLKSGTLYPS